MASDVVYEKCLPILTDEALDEETKTEKLEELVRQDTSLTGKLLENAVLDILWRARNATNSSNSSAPARHVVIRKNSPAPWQVSRTATPPASSPRSSAASPALTFNTSVRPSPFRAKSSTFGTSPFTSPRPSPRPNFASPQIPHSPNLNAYEFNEGAPSPDIYGDYGSDNVDWLVNDEVASNTSSSYTGDGYHNGSADWSQSQLMEMSPYDILRSVIRDEKTDDEIEKVLEANSYDLSAAIMSLMEAQSSDAAQTAINVPEQEKTYLVGKSMSPRSRPTTPAGQAKSKVPCRYWLSTGQCLRADCRFSHDLTNHVCKYWLAGNCLAGDSCIFSHDPSALMAGLSMNSQNSSAQADDVTANFQLHDFNAFPSLQNNSTLQANSSFESSLRNLYNTDDSVAAPPGLNSRQALAPEFIPSRPQSRPSSRHQSPAPKKADLAMDDSEAFPTLGSAAIKGTKKHHGKRGGHGHGHKDKDANPGTMADIVRMAPSPLQTPRKGFRQGIYLGSREYTAAARTIPAPEHIPWLETGVNANKAYLKARQQAIKHGGARNKFLQSAAQAWHRNDVRAAKALSLRGQSENDLMREAHREAARYLYEERNSHESNGGEVYIDLHGLHPTEAVSYLAAALSNQRSAGAVHRDAPTTLYAIIGTGHHSKAGRDKVGKAIRGFLGDCRYIFTEFSVPGDRGGSGGILGIDVLSGDMSRDAGSLEGEGDAAEEPPSRSPPSMGLHGKIRILKANESNSTDL